MIWALAAVGGAAEVDDWIVDTDASKHLACDASSLEDVEQCTSADWLMLPNSEQLEVTTKMYVTLVGKVDDKPFDLRLSEMFFAPKLARNLISYGVLVKRGCEFENRDGKMAVTLGERVVFTARMEGNVDMANVRAKLAPARAIQNMLMSVVARAEGASHVHEGCLLDFHRRSGDRANDTIERMAREPSSGIRLTDHR